MVSSKSTIKKIDRNTLFFNKFCYKVTLTAPSINWVRDCSSIDEYVSRVDERYQIWEENKDRYPKSWYVSPPSSATMDLTFIETLIALTNLYNDIKHTTYRCERDELSVYTSDIAVAETFSSLTKSKTITFVNPNPDGIRYFKKEPPASYRVYFSNSKVPIGFKDEMLAYLERTKDVTPSKSFFRFLSRNRNYGSYMWLYTDYYLDYNDEKNLMMMMLLFPTALGKKYKLLQK